MGIEAALERARDLTDRKAILWLANDTARVCANSMLHPIPTLKTAALCRAIAESPERIAAIVLESPRENPLIVNRFLKRVRELASAEGAMMIWAGTDSFPAELSFRPDLVVGGGSCATS